MGDRRCTASTYKNLATVAAAQGDSAGASRLYLDALVLRHELGTRLVWPKCWRESPTSRNSNDRDLDAATLLACAGTLRGRSGSVPSPRDVGEVDGTLATCRERIGEAAVGARFEHVAQMPVAEIVELTLVSCRRRSRPRSISPADLLPIGNRSGTVRPPESSSMGPRGLYRTEGDYV